MQLSEDTFRLSFAIGDILLPGSPMILYCTFQTSQLTLFYSSYTFFHIFRLLLNLLVVLMLSKTSINVRARTHTLTNNNNNNNNKGNRSCLVNFSILRLNQDHPDHSHTKISLDILKTPGDLRRFPVNQIEVKDHQSKLVRRLDTTGWAR